MTRDEEASVACSDFNIRQHAGRAFNYLHASDNGSNDVGHNLGNTLNKWHLEIAHIRYRITNDIIFQLTPTKFRKLLHEEQSILTSTLRF